MTDAEKPWYRDPPKLIPVLVGLTVLVPFAGAVISRLGPDEPEGRVEYVVDRSAAMQGRIGQKPKLPAVAAEIVEHAEARPNIATALRLSGGQACSAKYTDPDVGFATDNGDALRDALQGVDASGPSNFANAVTHAAGDIRGGSGLTTILIFVGGDDTCSKARSMAIIRRALLDLRDTPDVNVNFKFVGVKVPPRVRRLLERAKKQARQLEFVADTDYANKPSELPDAIATPTPTATPSPGDTPEPTP